MLVSRAGLSPVMVGRDAELEQLRGLAAGAPKPAIALIGGEPGIGKTRLASELARAVPRGTALLVGQADPTGTGNSYQLLRELAGDRHQELTTALGRGDPVERGRVARELLRALVSGGPALLVVDDLHWADPETLAVFEQLDDVADGPLLLVGTYRPGELSRRHPLAEALERLDRRRGVTHLRLSRLTLGDTASFLAAIYGHAPRRTVSALHQRTGGNPFFLEELLKAAGDTDVDEIHTQPLPWNLAEALRSQLDGLQPDRRQVVEAAAVLGARVSFDMLAAVTGLAEPEMMAALRDLVDRELLVETDEDHFGFRHALTREAVTGEMLGRQRRRLHEAALAAVQAMPDPDLAAVAVHARGSGHYDTMIEAARQGAACRLAAGSAYGALTLAEMALEEAPDDLDLRSLAATAAWRAGYVGDARRHAEHALRVAADDAQRVAALIQLIRVAWEQNELAEMADYTDRVRALIETLPDDEARARATAAVAQSHMLRHAELTETVTWADRACEVAERLGLKEVRLAALVEKGSALLMDQDNAATGRRLLTDVAAEAEDAGAYLEAARGWHNLFWYLPAQDPQAAEVLERMRVNAERAGVTGMALGAYHEGRALLALLAGDLDGAIDVLEQARRAGRSPDRIDPASSSAVSLHMSLSIGKHVRGRLAELYLERGGRGDLEAAETLLTEAPTTGKWKWKWSGRAYGLRYQLACRRGDAAAARRLLEELLTTLDGKPMLESATLHSHVAAGAEVGLPIPLLRRLADRDTGYHAIVDRPDHPLRLLITARLAEAEGRLDDALASYLSSVQAGEPEHGYIDDPLPPAYLATAQIGAARCLAHLGRLQEAQEQLAGARERLANWPGWRRAELVAVERRLGTAGSERGGASNGAAQGNAELTPREREVAALLAEGLTNTEIARRLVISRKTVAVHVSHILAKLEMSSRAQVAAWFASAPR